MLRLAFERLCGVCCFVKRNWKNPLKTSRLLLSSLWSAKTEMWQAFEFIPWCLFWLANATTAFGKGCVIFCTAGLWTYRQVRKSRIYCLSTVRCWIKSAASVNYPDLFTNKIHSHTDYVTRTGDVIHKQYFSTTSWRSQAINRESLQRPTDRVSCSPMLPDRFLVPSGVKVSYARTLNPTIKKKIQPQKDNKLVLSWCPDNPDKWEEFCHPA